MKQICPKCGEEYDDEVDMLVECPVCLIEGSTLCCNIGGVGCLCNECEEMEGEDGCVWSL